MAAEQTLENAGRFRCISVNFRLSISIRTTAAASTARRIMRALPCVCRAMIRSSRVNRSICMTAQSRSAAVETVPGISRSTAAGNVPISSNWVKRKICLVLERVSTGLCLPILWMSLCFGTRPLTILRKRWA